MEKEDFNYSEIDFWIGFGTVETIKGKNNYKIIMFKSGKLKVQWQDKSTFIDNIQTIKKIKDIILKYKKELISLSNLQKEQNKEFKKIEVCL